VRFGTSELGKSRNVNGPKRRHSNDANPKRNVHTECGRHGDDWLFGGFSVAGMKGLFWKKAKKPEEGEDG